MGNVLSVQYEECISLVTKLSCVIRLKKFQKKAPSLGPLNSHKWTEYEMSQADTACCVGFNVAGAD